MATVNLSIANTDKNIEGKSQLTKLYELMKGTIDQKFYGSVEIKFEAGKVTVVKKTESIKL